MQRVAWADLPGPLRQAIEARVDVTDGLESTLVMLGHKLRGGVTVVRDCGADVPRIEAYADELNQVWTNLIDNAVDAMDGRGTGGFIWVRRLTRGKRQTRALACPHCVIVILRRHHRTWRYWQAEDGVTLPLLLLPGYRRRPGIRLRIRVRRGGIR